LVINSSNLLKGERNGFINNIADFRNNFLHSRGIWTWRPFWQKDLVLGSFLLSLEQEMMAFFNPNIEMPQAYIDVLIKVAAEEGITAEQYAKQILMSFLGINHSKDLTGHSV